MPLKREKRICPYNATKCHYQTKIRRHAPLQPSSLLIRPAIAFSSASILTLTGRLQLSISASSPAGKLVEFFSEIEEHAHGLSRVPSQGSILCIHFSSSVQHGSEWS